MEVTPQLKRDLKLLQNGWITLYLKPFEASVLRDGEVEREVQCRYYVDVTLGVRCRAPESELEVFSRSTYDLYVWMPPGVGLPKTVDGYFGSVVKSEEVNGRLRRLKIGDLDVTVLQAGRALMLEAWRGEERLFTETIWLRGNDEDSGAIITRLFMRYMPVEQAIDAAVEILCNNGCDREWLKQGIREALTSERLEFPDTPLVAAVRFGPFVEKVENLCSQHFDVRYRQDPKYGEVTMITIPTACSYYNVWLRGVRRGLAVLCTANKPSRKPHEAIMEIGGIYLTERPLRLSYFDDGTAKCVDVGDKCLSAIRHLIQEEGLAVERSSELAWLKIVETQRYKAYYVDTISILAKLLILEIDGKKIGVVARNIDELEEKIGGIVYQNGDEELTEVAENALMYIKRRF